MYQFSTDSRESLHMWGAEDILSAQFCSEPEIALKNKLYL